LEPALADLWLGGVHEKLRRAEAHFRDLYAESRAFIEREPQPWGISIPYYDPESGWYICKAIVNEPAPIRLGVILGDVIHNARSALDHLVWQLVLANGQTPRAGAGGNMWPVALEEKHWKAAVKTRLRGVGAPQQALIQQAQPYKEGRRTHNTSPAVINALSNTDKHQVVHATAALLIDPGEEAKFSIRQGPGRIVRSEVRHGGRFEHGADLLRTQVEGRSAETEVWMDGRGPIEVAFGERPITISQISAAIEWVKVAVRDIAASLTAE
jgi:hypothetical protein